MPQTATAKPSKMTSEQQAILKRFETDVSLREQLVALLLQSPAAQTAPVVEEEPPAPRLTLRERIQKALLEQSMDLMQLTRAVHAERSKVQACVNEERKKGNIYNIGYEDSPVYTWRLNSAEDGMAVRRLIERLITERPMYVEDIVRAVGVDAKVVDQKIADIRRGLSPDMRISDLAPRTGYKPHGRARMYHIEPIDVPDARLKSQAETRREKAAAKAAVAAAKR